MQTSQRDTFVAGNVSALPLPNQFGGRCPQHLDPFCLLVVIFNRRW